MPRERASCCELLAGIEIDYLFLVGDIIDLWSLRKNFYRPQQHDANYLELRLKNAVRYVEACEHAAAHAALQRRRPGIRTIDGVLYCNDGDWVENRSALVEDMAGRLSICSWAQIAQGAPAPEPAGMAA